MSVALWMNRLPLITRRPWLAWRLGRVWASYTDGPACLTCRNSGIGAGAALEQHQVDPHADAADADDLADDVDDA